MKIPVYVYYDPEIKLFHIEARDNHQYPNMDQAGIVQDLLYLKAESTTGQDIAAAVAAIPESREGYAAFNVEPAYLAKYAQPQAQPVIYGENVPEELWKAIALADSRV